MICSLLRTEIILVYQILFTKACLIELDLVLIQADSLRSDFMAESLHR